MNEKTLEHMGERVDEGRKKHITVIYYEHYNEALKNNEAQAFHVANADKKNLNTAFQSHVFGGGGMNWNTVECPYCEHENDMSDG